MATSAFCIFITVGDSLPISFALVKVFQKPLKTLVLTGAMDYDKGYRTISNANPLRYSVSGMAGMTG
jgi:hypothetical protein